MKSDLRNLVTARGRFFSTTRTTLGRRRGATRPTAWRRGPVAFMPTSNNTVVGDLEARLAGRPLPPTRRSAPRGLRCLRGSG